MRRSFRVPVNRSVILLLCERLGQIALRARVARRDLREYPNDAGQGTEPLTINPSGAIVEFVVDSVRA